MDASVATLDSNQANYRCRVISDSFAFLNLQPSWEALRQGCPNNTPFLSWAWHFTWWQIYAKPGDQLAIILILKDEQLVALAPFYLSHPNYHATTNLRFIGTGEACHEAVVSEYLDILVQCDVSNCIYELIAEQVQLLKPAWDRAEFPNLLPNSHIEKLGRFLTPHVKFQRIRRGQRYRVVLPKRLDNYLASLEKNTRKRIERNQRRLSRLGQARFQWHETSSQDCEEALSLLADMHRERWSERLGQTIFDAERFTRFHDLLLPRLRRTKEAAIRTLFVDDTPLVSLYCFYSESTCFYYQSGFYKQHANYLSPLQLAHIFEMQNSIDQHRQYYDFMRGDDDSYKRAYQPECTPMSDLYWFRSARQQFWFKAKRCLKHHAKTVLKHYSEK